MTFKKLLLEAENKCKENDKEETVCKILLQHVMNLESYEILNKLDEQLDDSILLEYNLLLDKYLFDNIPIQHITGYEFFYGHKFIVSKDVLIPRFETEELVSLVLLKYDEIFKGEKAKLVDIGTGSGCISITLDLEEENLEVFASDISKEALEVAKKNQSNLESSVTFKQGDMLAPFIGEKFDILVSNPPYIPAKENVDSLVKDNEPNIALFGGDDGLHYYNIILSNAKSILKDKGFIAFEHAYNTADSLRELAKKYFPNAYIHTVKDMQNKDRFTFIEY